jgi:hypothetical protein
MGSGGLVGIGSTRSSSKRFCLVLDFLLVIVDHTFQSSSIIFLSCALMSVQVLVGIFDGRT